MSEPIEVTAATVEEAIKQALSELKALEEDVEIEVLATPRAGVLGLGARQAHVRVSLRPPVAAHSRVQSPPHAPMRPKAQETPSPTSVARPDRGTDQNRAPREAAPHESAPRKAAPRREMPTPAVSEMASAAPGEEARDGSAPPARKSRSAADLDQQAREASETLARILDLMSETAEVVRTTGDDPDALELEIKSDGSGLLIGRHGQTLDALEYLINRIVTRKIPDAAPITLETESYRARRRDQLHRMALAMGERAKREHEKVMLEPMPPRDRRIVHLALKEDPMVTTRSSGEGFLRAVEILPVGGPAHDRGGPSGGPGRGRQRERNKNRERKDGALGEQGGFKHGQKRIV